MLPKNIPFLLLLLCSLQSLAQGNGETDLQRMELKGRVKSVYECYYKPVMKDGKIAKGKKINNKWVDESLLVFNEKGYKTESSIYAEDSSIAVKEKYSYDDRQNMILEESYMGNGALVQSRKSILKYDDAGRITEEEWVGERGSKEGRCTYKYDEHGKVAEKCWYDAEGKQTRLIATKYNDKGYVTEVSEYGAKGKPDWRVVYKPDDNGVVSEQTWYEKGKAFFMRYVFTYDDKGSITQVLWCRENGKISRTWRLEYVYDAGGNWLKRTVYSNGKPKTLTERRVEYF